MSGSAAVTLAPTTLLHQRLAAVVRPEFAGAVIRVAPGDPVFGRGICEADCSRSAWTRGLCQAHYLRWRHHGRPDLEAFKATAPPVAATTRTAGLGRFDVSALRPQAQLEVGYAVQCRHDERGVRLLASTIRHLIAMLAAADVDSLLDRPLDSWLAQIAAKGWVDPSRTIGLVRGLWRRLIDLAEGGDAEAEFARDIWRARMLGIPRDRQPRQMRFDGIAQPWLRAAVKRHARFRLGAGKGFGSVDIDVRALRWLSRFLHACCPQVTGAERLSRDVIGRYTSWLGTQGLAGTTANTNLVCVRGFLESCRRYGWLPGLPRNAAIYLDELPRRPRPLPRFIPDYVMGQLEDPANLALLPDDTTRHLLIVIIETGLRAGDACKLDFNPIILDSVGWPCLRFHNTKMAAEQLVPLSPSAAEAIRAQQAHVTTGWPDATPPRLFPALRGNPDGNHGFASPTLRTRLTAWQERIGLHDEAGRPVRVTPHQFRHTLGTRMINAGVPQHVVQRLLGHASPEMTARYATLHDATVRAAFDDYQARRVNVHGERLGFDPDAPTADAEWIKHNLARIQASLPNGYCGRPPQQDCPHPNACLTCPDFQTTPEFLPIHRRQRDDTLVLVELAERDGRARQAANHRQVHANLQLVIDGLEAIAEETQP